MLEVLNINFSYDKKPTLKGISFNLEDRKHLAIMGESGSGKSTLLKIIYGLLAPDKGECYWRGKKILGPNFQLIPGESSMKLVFQELNLMPHTTVFENIRKNLSVFEQENHTERIEELLNIVEMQEFAHTKTKYLSGGQKQRIALAQAIAQEPEVLLLDEPFSNIDQFLKNKLRLQFFSNLKEKGITLITASHDPEDVIPFADQVLVIKNGQTVAIDTPKMLFDKPKNRYTASLFGYVNELPIDLLSAYDPNDTNILIYPHEFQLSSDEGIQAFVVNNHFYGGHYLIESVSKKGHTIYFTNPNALKIHTLVFLNVPLSLVNKRMVQKEV
ncbi:ABC transporter ATP-binding protein [Croceivirga lutea]|uniref:ABC transporter ATP-binding protein n=1 Tax=Croceivirga lutea TaxID=1775167 RepID=UPI00163A7EAD|nr:ABC transporter ATP-binding protein [Croceivirga lutea]GGG38426.1 ABC transporter ATP-binding protein [Croceivirga lutea]